MLLTLRFLLLSSSPPLPPPPPQASISFITSKFTDAMTRSNPRGFDNCLLMVQVFNDLVLEPEQVLEVFPQTRPMILKRALHALD